MKRIFTFALALLLVLSMALPVAATDTPATTVYNEAEPLLCGIQQPWYQTGGCTVDPGQGTWLVKGFSTAFSIDGDRDGDGALEQTHTETVEGTDVVHSLVTLPGEAILLAREETVFGGSVFLSGGMFPADVTLDPGGDNPWDSSNGNGLLMEALLEMADRLIQTVPVYILRCNMTEESVKAAYEAVRKS